MGNCKSLRGSTNGSSVLSGDFPSGNGGKKGFEQKYSKDKRKLGDGRAGKVYTCTHKDTRRIYAVKFVAKSGQTAVECEREIEILNRLRGSEHIINLNEIFEDRRYLLLVTELCRGGELYDQIVAKSEEDRSDDEVSTGGFSEREAALMMRQIFVAIDVCHQENVVHRDIKPENIMLVEKDDVSQLRLIDFGLSRFFENGKRMRTRVGTVYYTAPEVWKQDYDEKCDCWSLGVILYVLICSYPPFDGDNDEEILNTVMKGRYKFHSPEWDTVSDEAKSLIKSLLQRNSRKRPSAAQALDHAWFQTQLSDASESSDEGDGLEDEGDELDIDVDDDAWDDDYPEETPESSRLKGISGGASSGGSGGSGGDGSSGGGDLRPEPVISEESSRELTESDLGGLLERANGTQDLDDDRTIDEPRATSLATSSFNTAHHRSGSGGGGGGDKGSRRRQMDGSAMRAMDGRRGGGGGGGGGRRATSGSNDSDEGQYSESQRGSSSSSSSSSGGGGGGGGSPPKDQLRKKDYRGRQQRQQPADQQQAADGSYALVSSVASSPGNGSRRRQRRETTSPSRTPPRPPPNDGDDGDDDPNDNDSRAGSSDGSWMPSIPFDALPSF